MHSNLLIAHRVMWKIKSTNPNTKPTSLGLSGIDFFVHCMLKNLFTDASAILTVSKVIVGCSGVKLKGRYLPFWESHNYSKQDNEKLLYIRSFPCSKFYCHWLTSDVASSF